MPRLRNAAACEKALERAMAWLRTYCGEEEWADHGHPLAAYHKMPYLYAISGHPEHCRRALAWVRSYLLARDGNLVALPAVKDQPAVAARNREKAWIALAAHVSGRLDVSFPAARFLAAQQGRTTGGVYDVDAENRREESADVRTTATAGLVFLNSGMCPEARLAARFLVRAMQPQAEGERFFTRLNGQGKLVSKFPRGTAESHVVAASDRRSLVGYLGLPAIFLARMHMASGETEWLESAMDYFAFGEQCAPEAIVAMDSSALAWAASALYGITRRRRYYDFAERLVQAWLDSQRPDGTWRSQGAVKDDAATLNLTVRTATYLLESLREAQ